VKTADLRIERTWDGLAVAPEEVARVELQLTDLDLSVQLVAPFHRDAPPATPAGSTDRLWEYEVVELFLLGREQRYLELEFGPFGHYLVLALEGPRNLVRSGIPIAYEAQRTDAGWTGRARIDADQLPPGLAEANAYAIHGSGPARRYLAAHPVPGPAPDFHRLEFFRPLEWT
jgi:hypothetical protein